MLSSREVTAWQAYYQVEPFGEYKADLRMAMLLSLLANIYRDDKKHPQPFTVEDFMPACWKEERREEGIEVDPMQKANIILNSMMTWAAKTGADIVVKENNDG